MTTSLSPATAPDELTPEQLELQQRARAFVEDVLFPLEEEAERSGGRCPTTWSPASARRRSLRASTAAATRPSTAARAGRCSSGSSSTSSSGAPPTACTGTCPSAYNVLTQATPEQIDRYLRPPCAARAATPPTRSPRRRPARTRRASPPRPSAPSGGWVIERREVVRHLRRRGQRADRDGQRDRGRREAAHAVPGRAGRRPASRSSTTRPSRTTTRTATPRSASPTSRCPTTRVIGGLGSGDDLQRAWFTEERLGIATHGLGAMWRLLDETTAWAIEREQGGSRIMDYQGVSFPLADSATDAAGGPAAGDPRRAAGRRRGRPQAHPRQGVDGQAVRERGRLAAARTAPCRYSAAAATCAPTSPSASAASCAWTGSGRARARSSG